jgi:hypothetical protein
VTTITFFVVTITGFWLLFGPRITLFATVAALWQFDFTHWLTFLSTDGPAIALWAACLVATGLIARDGRRRWYVVLGVAVLLLAMARPTGSLAPLVPVLCAGAAALARRPVWRRFALAGVAAGIPAGVVLLAQHQLGAPGLSDVLQEIPTRHFALPDIADPFGYTVSLAWWAVSDRLLPTLLTSPILLAGVVVGFAGFALRPSWAALPFLVGAVVMPLAWLIHPVWFDAGRILAPVWVSLNLGIAFTIDWAAVRWGDQIRAAAGWASRPAPEATG